MTPTNNTPNIGVLQSPGTTDPGKRNASSPAESTRAHGAPPTTNSANHRRKVVRTDLGIYLEEQVYPALYDRLENAFLEFVFRDDGGDRKVATLFPADLEAENRNPGRIVCNSERPWQFMTFGRRAIRWLDYVNGGQKPRGRRFIECVRDLCERAGVPFPGQEMTPEQRDQAARWEERRTVLAAVLEICQESLWTETGRAARDYLHGRGFTEDDLRTLGFGFYTSARAVCYRLKLVPRPSYYEELPAVDRAANSSTKQTYTNAVHVLLMS
jgi:hypothetical protein